MSTRQYLIIFVLLLLALAPSLAVGAGMPAKIVPCDGVNCTVCDLANLGQNILNTAIFIAVFLSAVLFAWAGVRMLISPASSSEVGKAKDLFYNVLIGFIIILSAWLIINVIMSMLVTGSPQPPWNKICPSVQTGPGYT